MKLRAPLCRGWLAQVLRTCVYPLSIITQISFLSICYKYWENKDLMSSFLSGHPVLYVGSCCVMCFRREPWKYTFHLDAVTDNYWNHKLFYG